MLESRKIKKSEGFHGQKAIIIPRKVLQRFTEKNIIANSLYITDIGYYPKAKFHFRERVNGSEQDILICCIEGKGHVRIGKVNYSLSAGEFIVIPANTQHVYESDKNNPWSIYWIHFKGTVSEAIIKMTNKKLSGFKGVLHHIRKTERLFDEIYEQLESGYSFDNLTSSSMCLWHFLSTCIFKVKKEEKGLLKAKDSVDIAIDFLKNNSDKSLNLHEIAQEVNLSPSHFSYLFKNKTGYSPIEYFNHLKIQKACQFLLFTTNRVKEISFELGIEDPYYFSRLFKKVMGVSPEEYRSQRKA